MVKSMTGYGRAENSSQLFNLKIEIKCVNSKYCDINMRLPKLFSMQEIPLRAVVQQKLIRGKIDIFIEAKFQKPVQTPVLNRPNFMSCLSVLEQMKKLGGLTDEISLSNMLFFNDLIDYESESVSEDMNEFLKNTLIQCLDAVDDMRVQEGANLKAQIELLLDKLSEYRDTADNARKDIALYWSERFRSRMQELGVSENNDRIVQEAAIYTEKSDISEELTRISSHISQFHKIMDNEPVCGKKLDFLCQELYREWNTIASKSIKAEIINTVVDAKSVVDSIREQVQNII